MHQTDLHLRKLINQLLSAKPTSTPSAAEVKGSSAQPKVLTAAARAQVLNAQRKQLLEELKDSHSLLHASLPTASLPADSKSAAASATSASASADTALLLRQIEFVGQLFVQRLALALNSNDCAPSSSSASKPASKS